MSFILGLAESSWIGIGLFILPLLVGAFLRYKAKADKSDIKSEIMIDVKKEIAPIERRLEKHEDSINKLVTNQEVIHEKVDNILTGQERLMNFMIRISDKLDSKKDK